jgi:hypothetical protein
MALNANALASFAEAQALFGYAADEQTKVESLINTASARIEGYCKRALAARDSVFILDGTGCPELVLPEYPVNTVTRLTIDSSRVFAVASDTAATDYAIKIESGILVLYSGVFSSVGSVGVIRVQCNAGYASTHAGLSVLKSACLEYVDWSKSRYATPGSIGKKGEYSADRISVSFETDMPMHIRSMLEPFRKVSA